MKLIAVVLAAGMLAGCATKPIRQPSPDQELNMPSRIQKALRLDHPSDVSCPDYANITALRAVQRAVPYQFNSGSWDATWPDIDEEQKKILELYKWSRGLPDPVERQCWEHWLWYYDYQLAAARKALSAQEAQQKYEQSHEFTEPK